MSCLRVASLLHVVVAVLVAVLAADLVWNQGGLGYAMLPVLALGAPWSALPLVAILLGLDLPDVGFDVWVVVSPLLTYATFWLVAYRHTWRG